MGNRLKPLTIDKPKCLVELDGKPLLGYTIEALDKFEFEKLIIITGYQSQCILDYIQSLNTSLDIEVVHNDRYDSTNNIFSIYLAEQLIEDGFVIIESDLIFDQDLLYDFQQPDRVALDVFNPDVHNGTAMSVRTNGGIDGLYLKSEYPEGREMWKTVNIYSFSKQSGRMFLDEISDYVENGHVNIFYECTLKDLIQNGSISFQKVDFTNKPWFEIDTPEDLQRAQMSLELIMQ